MSDKMPRSLSSMGPMIIAIIFVTAMGVGAPVSSWMCEPQCVGELMSMGVQNNRLGKTMAPDNSLVQAAMEQEQVMLDSGLSGDSNLPVDEPLDQPAAIPQQEFPEQLPDGDDRDSTMEPGIPPEEIQAVGDNGRSLIEKETSDPRVPTK